MKRILMATDLSARSDRAFARAMHLARDHQAELTIVHVVDESLPAPIADAQGDAARQAIEAQVAADRGDATFPISIEVVFGRPYLDILEMSERQDAELVILGLHREDAFKDMFRGTTAERVIRAGNAPVLLVKEPANRPYKKIMVGVDFSVYSRRAIEFAVAFVPTGVFHLVHAFDVPFKGFAYGHDTRRGATKQHQLQFQKMIDEEMETFLAGVEPKAPKVQTAMQEGTVRDVIDKQVARLQPDLLVVGTHGRTGVAHAFLGSVAEDLLRDPPCDVFAVNAW